MRPIAHVSLHDFTVPVFPVRRIRGMQILFERYPRLHFDSHAIYLTRPVLRRGGLLHGRQEAADAGVIRRRADDPAQEGADDGDPKDRDSVGEAVIFEAGGYREEARAEIAGRVDGEAMQAAEAHA